MDSQSNSTIPVLIIGAGPAGIGAAVTLHQHNIPFLILEARNRIGGRVYSEIVDGIRIDVGACWVHSYSETNPMRPYVEQLKIEQLKIEKQKQGVMIDRDSGEQFDEQTFKQAQIACQQLQQKIKQKVQQLSYDQSFYDVSKQYFESYINKLPIKQKKCVSILLSQIQNYEAASFKQISAKYYDFKKETSTINFMPKCTYSQFLKKIAERFQQNIKINHEVCEVEMEASEVIVKCKNGAVIQAKKLISSLPLGILKLNRVTFKPELPRDKVQAIKRLGFGLMNKIIVSFQKPFWHSASWILIDTTESDKFSFIYDLSQEGKYILGCLITDDFAKRNELLSDKQIVEDFLKFLRRAYKDSQINVKQYLITRWSKQQFSLGSYSSFHTGSSPDDCYQIRKPINDMIWMVGQHCYAQHIGTAHGAFQTGANAALQITSSLKIQCKKVNNQL